MNVFGEAAECRKDQVPKLTYAKFSFSIALTGCEEREVQRERQREGLEVRSRGIWHERRFPSRLALGSK